MAETPQAADLFTIGDVAKRAGVSASAVRNWARDGKLAQWGETAGGIRLFARAAVDACLASREVDRAEREAGR